MKSAFSFLVVGLIAALTFGCSSQDNNLSTVSTAFSNISGEFVPDSLEYNASGGYSNLHAVSGDPCEGVSSLAECQPILLRLYLDLSKMIFDIVKEMVSASSTNLGELPNGTGSITVDGLTFSYSKTSNSKYSVLVTNASDEAFMYIDIDGSTYTTKTSVSNAPDEILGEAADGHSPEVMETVVSYSSETSWSLTATMTGFPCNSEDVGAPQTMKLLVTRNGNLWTGKAMMYHPRWGGDYEGMTCDTEPTDDTARCLYTEYVADNTAAKANVYILPRTVSEVSEFASYEIGTVESGLTNPFCNPTATMIAVWDNACSDYSSTVYGASFGDSSEWVVPSILYQLEVTMPSSL